MNPVQQAILNTPVDYLQKTLSMRNPGPKAQGSVFSEEQDPVGLSKASWEPYSHPEIQAPAKGFKAAIPGFFGMVKISELDPEKLIHFVPSRKGTGYVDATIIVSAERAAQLRKPVDFTVALVGPGDEEGKDVLWTVFPGDPTPPSTMLCDGLPEEMAVSAAHALKLGLEWAKIEVQ